MISKRYREFFVDSTEGKEFVEKLESLIHANYEKAERRPDSARDISQQNMGIREVINEIKRLSIKQ